MKCTRTLRKLVFTFDNLPSIEFDSEQTAFDHDADAAMHGYEQKIRDNAAIARKQKDGTVITVTEAMRRDAVQEMVTHLLTADSWNMKGNRTPARNPTWEAIAAKRGMTYEAYIAERAAKDLEELAGME